jgi:hypothetical protein
MIQRLFRIRVDVSVLPAHVLLVCTGKYSRAEAFRISDLAYREATKADRRNVLVDVRQVNGRLPTLFDRFEIGVRLASLHFEQLPRVRLALLGDEPMIHPERFGEIVARNRGADTRAFTEELEALKWLLAA